MRKLSNKVFAVVLMLTIALTAMPFGFAPVAAHAAGMSLRITRSTDTPTASVGGVVSYTIAVTNEGSESAASTILPEALDSKLRYLGSTATQGYYDSDTGWWAIGSVAGGQTQTLVVTAEVLEAGENIQGLITVPEGSTASPTDITLTLQPSPSFIGNVSLEAVVSPEAATGNVTFSIGGAPVHVAQLINGAAIWTYAFEAVGDYEIAVEYSGDANHRSSKSEAYTHTVHVPVTIRDIPGVTPPVAGATPVTAITETSQYTGTVTWSDDPAVFAGNTAYTATITLAPKAGYTLDGIMADFFNVADAAKVTYEAHSTVVKATFERTEDTGTLRAKKTVTGTGATLAEGEFQFGVFDESGYLVSIGTNAQDGSVVFDPFAYPEPGEYTFTVREISPSVGGWTTDSNEYPVAATIIGDMGRQVVIIGEQNEEIEFVNVYEPYALTVNAGAGGFVNPPSMTLRSDGELISVLATPNNGYRFTGWTIEGATLADDTANPAVFSMPASAVSLMANFQFEGAGAPPAQAGSDTVRLALRGNGGVFEDGSPTVILTCEAGDELGTPDEPTRDGYVFKGWFTKRAGGERVEEDFEITEDTALVARWARRIAVVATGGPDAYLRKGPGTQHGIVAQYPNGSEVLYLGESDGWYRVQVIADGEKGYMHGSLVQLP